MTWWPMMSLPLGCTVLMPNEMGALFAVQRCWFHVRDGRITETWSYHHDQHDFDAFWA